jgi:hypothetical protein
MGAIKYSRRNWLNCEDPQTYKESAARHLMQYIHGETDEDHLSAAAANILIQDIAVTLDNISNDVGIILINQN